MTGHVAIGNRLGDYEITARLGAGGMGEVFRARDTKLGRDVAVKILPAGVAADADRQQRFQREARILASLNHPNIGSIYGLINDGGVTALVLELVEGPTLAEKLASGPLRFDDAISVARQIADAVDNAHERGIIHRDLKPANIKVTADGTVKVLDFGIAKVLTPVDDAATRTADATKAGSVIGTAGYMSPEQTRGVDIDKRTDIWAFGCIVYEMLTGDAAFARATNSDTIVAILEREPDWSRVPAATPPLVMRMLHRCLEKDVKRRQRDIADAAADLKGLDRLQPEANELRHSRPWLAWAAGAILGVAGTAIAFVLMRDTAAQLDLSKETLTQVTFDTGLTDMPAISPDGRLLVYSSDRTGRGDLDLYVEQTSGGAPIRLTDDPADDMQPSFSPDGSQIAFRSERDGGGLYVVPALGGNARRLVDGGRWPRFSPDGGRIAYWQGPWRGDATQGTGAVFVLDLAGGNPAPIAAGLFGAREPVWSPDGKSLLVLGRQSRESLADLYLVRLDGGVPIRTGVLDGNDFRSDIARLSISSTILGDWNDSGVLMSTASGVWLLPLSARDGNLRADPLRLTVSGGRHIHPARDRSGAIVFALAEGPRVIARAPLNNDGPATVLYTDALAGGTRPSQTPDGSRVVYERRINGFVDFLLKQDGVADRLLVRAPRDASNPVISPDAQVLAYTAYLAGSLQPPGDGYTLKVAGGVPTRICRVCEVWGFFSDSRRVLVLDDAGTRLRALDLQSGDSRVILKARTPIARTHLSPDDRRLTFTFEKAPWIAPVYPDRPTAQSEWRKIDQDTEGARGCGWSMDSQIAYLLLDTDGFRCLWGQRVDPKTAELIGKPFAVRHFHQTVNQEFSTSFGNAISEQGFIYGGGILKANLWRLTLPH